MSLFGLESQVHLKLPYPRILNFLVGHCSVIRLPEQCWLKECVGFHRMLVSATIWMTWSDLLMWDLSHLANITIVHIWLIIHVANSSSFLNTTRFLSPASISSWSRACSAWPPRGWTESCTSAWRPWRPPPPPFSWPRPYGLIKWKLGSIMSFVSFEGANCKQIPGLYSDFTKDLIEFFISYHRGLCVLISLPLLGPAPPWWACWPSPAPSSPSPAARRASSPVSCGCLNFGYFHWPCPYVLSLISHYLCKWSFDDVVLNSLYISV